MSTEPATGTASHAPPESDLPGPYPVGQYAAQLKRRLLEFARVQLVGEVWGFRASRARVYFELRDARGALPCSMWLSDFQSLNISLSDGVKIVVGGGCDYYPGSASSSPSFTFAVAELRVAGEGDLLVQLERLRRRLHADGLFEPQKRLPRPLLPRTIGVVTGERGKARDDVLAGLRRRGWSGRLIWAFAPVQDRHAAPRIATALRDLAAIPEVDVVIVARGGGSLADLFAFCDEALCRTVAILRVPVISSVGHHTDRTLIDDVAAVCCSTPTHAAEAAVPIDCRAARADIAAFARQLQLHSRRAVVHRARALERLSRAPSQHIARQRRRLHQLLRELRASARRTVHDRRSLAGTHLLVLGRTTDRARTSGRQARERELHRLALALAAHDPQRTLERGYALVEDRAGEALGSAAAARAARALRLRFHDGAVPATVADEPAVADEPTGAGEP
jgi:exodeoxyribonuclease VII large subunit